MIRVSCGCGVEKVMFASTSYRKDVVSCGCKRSDMHQKMTGEKNYRFGGFKEICLTLWDKIRKNAAARGIEFSLSIGEAWDLFERQNRTCALSGVPIAFGLSYPQRETTASLDRIDSGLSYEVGNVQWVHKRINMMKGALTVDEFRSWCSAVVRGGSC